MLGGCGLGGRNAGNNAKVTGDCSLPYNCQTAISLAITAQLSPQQSAVTPPSVIQLLEYGNISTLATCHQLEVLSYHHIHISTVELETKVYPKVRNHGEGPY